MANEAHKEPTMEEILASIRKIISDDDTSAPLASVEAVADISVEEDDDALEAFDVSDLVEDDELGDADIFGDTGGASDTQQEETVLEDFAAIDDVPEAPQRVAAPSFEDIVAAADEPTAPAEITRPDMTPPPIVDNDTNSETDMSASAKYQQTVLTDENTADQAAGALGKLISRMDLGGDNTIEGLVREMLKPMIKEWLDANLPDIVEQKVEAEVQRIARMAR